jgi:hypothetical protein
METIKQVTFLISLNKEELAKALGVSGQYEIKSVDLKATSGTFTVTITANERGRNSDESKPGTHSDPV